jgi:uncharacterized membrane protein YgcG
MKAFFNLLLIFGLAAFAARAQAQYEVPPPMPAAPTFNDAQLQQLVGPIALYPDPLIAVMLPAAALPTEIVVADRYVGSGGDFNQIDQQGWDPNVQALAHYPAVLKWMDDNLTWTTQLGEAFQNQQQDVMNAVQELRTDAYNLGNLQSTPQEQVINDNGYIEILPVNPDNVYVPNYQPNQVYYDQPVGVPFVTFSVGYVIGPWLCGDFDWRNHHLISWDRDHPRPSDWWHRRPEDRDHFIDAGHAPVWNGGNRRPVAPAFGGDRGYNNNLPWTAPAANGRGQPQHPQPQQQLQQQQLQQQHLQQQHLEPQHVENTQPPPNNAFIGIQSARDTRDYSNRGEHSMQTMPQFRDLGGFHGGNAPPPPSSGFRGGGGAPSGGGGSRGSSPPPSGGGGGGGRH